MANGNFGGGNGTAENPYLVEDAHDLYAIRNYLGDRYVYFKQVSDIDLSSFENWVPIQNGTDTSYNNVFCGKYDGSGYKIVNMTCHHERNYVGLFGYTYFATIENVFIENCNVSGGEYVGSLVGGIYSSEISNCYASGSVNGDLYVGGLIGDTNSATRTYSITYCHTSVSTSGNIFIGGLIGQNVSYNVSNCYASGDVSGNFLVGGLIGNNYNSSVYKCYASGNVSGSNEVGGLFGGNYNSSVFNCYASGDVGGFHWVGGLVGDNSDGSVLNCYASGDVSGTNMVGGLVGGNASDGTISNSYALSSLITKIVYFEYGTDFSDIANGNGTIEDCYSLDTLKFKEIYPDEGKEVDIDGNRQGALITKEQAMQRQTYENLTGWDFENIWEINEGVDYPRLIIIKKHRTQAQTHCKAFIRQAGSLILTPVSD